MLQATTFRCWWMEALKLGSVFKQHSTVAEQYEFLRAVNSWDIKSNEQYVVAVDNHGDG